MENDLAIFPCLVQIFQSDCSWWPGIVIVLIYRRHRIGVLKGLPLLEVVQRQSNRRIQELEKAREKEGI